MIPSVEESDNRSFYSCTTGSWYTCARREQWVKLPLLYRLVVPAGLLLRPLSAFVPAVV